ncbi:CPBP family intramembrane glutamic endopeptidase [Thalassoroseus pseudoceratinae]|uniref:CPBP family intramembrane glutamic endopeptidase n=1 Tax=Thalassoroseus pseudoceratinae TaxID=2713176 RepID=UPI00141F4389|nr:CPBP family intramembrane glutamic endopeptidase [Thalassoroseus pseudoceratinae]
MVSAVPTISSMEPANEYWDQTRRPLVCLVFLLPVLVVYEIGVLWHSNPENDVRNGADAWMRLGLEHVGVQFHWLVPIAIVFALLAWHFAIRDRWRMSLDTLLGMFAESLLFAFLLIVFGQMQNLAFERLMPTDAVSIPAPSLSIKANVPTQETPANAIGSTAIAVTYLGAGIYEEFLFRLCLLPALYGLALLTRMPKRWAAVFAVLVTSLLFAGAHHVGPIGEPFAIFPFVFRCTAGLVFSALFVLRGFGITVGCHAAYDLLVGVLLVVI